MNARPAPPTVPPPRFRRGPVIAGIAVAIALAVSYTHLDVYKRQHTGPPQLPMYTTTLAGQVHAFADLKTLMAKATPARSGDALAGLAATSALERVAAQMALADLPLGVFLQEALVPYESDEVTRLIIDGHDARAFAPVSALTVGGLRDWLLSDAATPAALQALSLIHI